MQAAGGRQGWAPQAGAQGQEADELGSCSSEEEVSVSAHNWPRVQRELLRALSPVETCYFPPLLSV